ncbi:sensor histidine kinase [Actinoplanes sp. LDG1-06]|uniref:Sensor histidine kinase n=1 Tax=Paractinoplanes ovalisporus TaxID=2810368 RepID=A0ABS2A557_9ACTN|nr:sensor histidine kinase [Actinoplanes ovalisporus]MBM2614973.1 sensor histidine kinase [Actinoplanes ovalisporus]
MPNLDARAPAGSQAGAAVVLRRSVVTVAVGGVTFLITNGLNQPPSVALTLSILTGGIVLVVMLLAGFEARQESVETALGFYAEDVRTLAAQRDDEIRQSGLLERYIEEQIPRIIGETLNRKQREDPLIRELAHSLNTPLAQMEAILIARHGDGAGRDTDDLLVGVQVCKSFLAAFRELATLARDTQAWEPASLADALDRAAQLYTKRLDGDVSCETRMPERIVGYGNNFVLAVVLPLLENAVEASPPYGKVSVFYRATDDENVIEVANDLRPGVTLDPLMYRESWSSKPGHLGLGLRTVSDLLSTHHAAGMSHTVDPAGRVTFAVNLRRRSG